MNFLCEMTVPLQTVVNFVAISAFIVSLSVAMWGADHCRGGLPCKRVIGGIIGLIASTLFFILMNSRTRPVYIHQPLPEPWMSFLNEVKEIDDLTFRVNRVQYYETTWPSDTPKLSVEEAEYLVSELISLRIDCRKWIAKETLTVFEKR